MVRPTTAEESQISQ
jgi:hypothetical protein